MPYEIVIYQTDSKTPAADSRRVYSQSVSSLDILAVIRAVNGLPGLLDAAAACCNQSEAAALDR